MKEHKQKHKKRTLVVVVLCMLEVRQRSCERERWYTSRQEYNKDFKRLIIFKIYTYNDNVADISPACLPACFRLAVEWVSISPKKKIKTEYWKAWSGWSLNNGLHIFFFISFPFYLHISLNKTINIRCASLWLLCLVFFWIRSFARCCCCYWDPSWWMLTIIYLHNKTEYQFLNEMRKEWDSSRVRKCIPSCH